MPLLRSTYQAALKPGPALLPGPLLRGHGLYLSMLLLYGLAAFATALAIGRAGTVRLSIYNESMLLVLGLCALVFFLGHTLYWMIWRRPARLIGAIAGDLGANYLTRERLLPGALVLMTLPSFTSIFTAMKMLIPELRPFSWDPAFAAWDRALHGGTDPWRLLHPLLDQPWITTAINACYHLWFFILFAVIFWQAFSVANPRLRMRFFLSFVLAWALIGTLAATLLSSAGPVYYERVTGDAAPFGPLMASLTAAAEVSPVWALDVQEMLWANYSAGKAELGGGISAMPSLHVAMAVLFVLLAASVSRLLAWLFGAFALVIMIGSVHLGWHYAIDGYVSAVIMWLIWGATKWLVPAPPH